MDGQFLDSTFHPCVAGMDRTASSEQGSPLPGCRRSVAPASYSCFPSPQAPRPLPRVHAGHWGGGGDREAGGAQRIPISLLPPPPKGLILEGDLELCGGPMWFEKGGTTDEYTDTHAAQTPMSPARSRGYPGLLPARGFVQSWHSVGGC